MPNRILLRDKRGLPLRQDHHLGREADRRRAAQN